MVEARPGEGERCHVPIRWIYGSGVVAACEAGVPTRSPSSIR